MAFEPRAATGRLRVTGLAVLLAVPLVMTAACGGEPPWREATKVERGMIQAAADDYRAAIAAGNAQAARVRVTIGTFAACDRLRRLALDANATELRAVPIVDRVRVLAIRARYESAALESDASTMFDRFVEDGILMARDGEAGPFDVIEVRGDEARSPVAVGAPDATGERPFIALRREAKVWRLDVESLNHVLAPAWRAMHQNYGGNDAALLRLVSELVGRPVETSIWRPLRG